MRGGPFNRAKTTGRNICVRNVPNQKKRLKRTKNKTAPICAVTCFLWSRWADLNRRPADYESAALPLSHIGMNWYQGIIKQLLWHQPLYKRIRRLTRTSRLLSLLLLLGHLTEAILALPLKNTNLLFKQKCARRPGLIC